MKSLLSGLLTVPFLCAAIVTSIQHARAFVTDENVYEVPNIPRPGYLIPITDPVFGTTVIRVTEAGQPIYNPTSHPSLVGESWDFETGHGYSSRVSWNADQSLLMLEKGVHGEVFLDGQTLEPLFRRSVPGSGRWHPSDPNVMYFVESSVSKNLKKPPVHCVGAYEPRNDTVIWQRCFNEYDEISWSDPGKGKPSIYGDIIPILALRGSDKHWVAFLYDVDTDSVSDEIDMTSLVADGDSPDFTMSPLGDTIIINGCIIDDAGVHRCKAQVAIDVATKTELWRVLTYHDPGHADEIIDEAGEQWRVGRSKGGIGGTIKRNFRTGEAVSLVPYGASHTSTRAIFGRSLAILSFHTSSGPFQNEILGVCVDGSCLERYAHTHRFDDGRYLAESQGSVSPLGDKIVFRSNWDEDMGPIDAYVIDLSGTSSPGPAPDPVTAPAVTITAPADGASFAEGANIAFSGTAIDAEDGDLTASLAWTSNPGGPIGTGGSFSTTLSLGVHTIAAAVTDTSSTEGSDRISITVTSETVPTGLEATPYKVKGVQHVDLTWNGGINNVDIVRDGVVIATTPNDGSYTDNLNTKGGGDVYVYQACEAGTQTCSNTARATF
jgi:hypothetical protein